MYIPVCRTPINKLNTSFPLNFGENRELSMTPPKVMRETPRKSREKDFYMIKNPSVKRERSLTPTKSADLMSKFEK